MKTIAFNLRHLLSRSFLFLESPWSGSSSPHPQGVQLSQYFRWTWAGVARSGRSSHPGMSPLPPWGSSPEALDAACEQWLRSVSESLPVLWHLILSGGPVSSHLYVPTQSSCSWFQPRVHVSAFTPLSRVPYSTCLCDVTPPPENTPTAESEPAPCSSCHRSHPGPLRGDAPSTHRRAPSELTPCQLLACLLTWLRSPGFTHLRFPTLDFHAYSSLHLKHNSVLLLPG